MFLITKYEIKKILQSENSSVPNLQVCIGKWPPAIGWDGLVGKWDERPANEETLGDFGVVNSRDAEKHVGIRLWMCPLNSFSF